MICIQKTILGVVINYQLSSDLWIVIASELAYEIGQLSCMSHEYVLTHPYITIIKDDDEKFK